MINRRGKINQRTRQNRFPILYILHSDAPRSLERYRNGNQTQRDIFAQWRNQPIELYGSVIRGYGTEAPWNRDHVACRLGLPGAKAYTVVNIDEVAGSIADLPIKPIG